MILYNTMYLKISFSEKFKVFTTHHMVKKTNKDSKNYDYSDSSEPYSMADSSSSSEDKGMATHAKAYTYITYIYYFHCSRS